MKTKFLLLPLIVCSVIFFGCGMSDEDEDPGRRPVVTAVYFYKNASTIPTSNFNVDDEIAAEVHLEDPDLDIVTLYITIYDLDNTGTPYAGPNAYELDPAQSSDFSISEKLNVALPSGAYRIDFQVVDEKGLASLIYRKRLYVE
jgi:hypothetical protein